MLPVRHLLQYHRHQYSNWDSSSVAVGVTKVWDSSSVAVGKCYHQYSNWDSSSVAVGKCYHSREVLVIWIVPLSL